MPAKTPRVHARATAVDPTITTSVPHTLFLAGDYAVAIETYSRRTGYYLDAAAWAGLGDKRRAAMLLRDRLDRMSLSGLMAGLMQSLLAVVEDRASDAFSCMESMRIDHEPEALVYLAKHYSQIGAGEAAVEVIPRAARSGFVCAPSALRTDVWLGAVRSHPAFGSVLIEADNLAGQARSNLRL